MLRHREADEQQACIEGERLRGGCLLVELHLAALKHRLEVVRQMLLVPLQQAAVRKVE